MTVIDTLVTDRTAADVERVEELSSKGIAAMTAAELAEYLAGMKGAYNAADLNRVEAAIRYVAERLSEHGHTVTLNAARSWTQTTIPTPAMATLVLKNLSTLRGALRVPSTTPAVPPDMENLTFTEANDIERILVEIDRLLTDAAAAFRHCNAAVCGGGGLLIR